jgi:protein-L-isoaspartate(D-aspartate) O-methyltransferase
MTARSPGWPNAATLGGSADGAAGCTTANAGQTAAGPAREHAKSARAEREQQVSSEASTASSARRGEIPAPGRDPGPAGELREAMVRRLREEALIVSGPVAAAFRAVPRHLFAPRETLEAAYDAHGTVVPKRDADGLLLSVMSAPQVQAMMLEMAGIEPGMRVLEVGSGGYNAALIAELAGRAGAVTTIDIDPDVTSRARACLDGAGYERVRVVTGDAEYGVAGGSPYDRIIVTAGSWDLPPAWISQLAPAGRLIVPLRLRGLMRTVVFEREAGGLVSRAYRLAAFVPFQGDGAHADRTVILRHGVALHTDDPGLPINAPALNAALDMPRLELWPGAKFDFPDELGLFITLSAPRVAQLHASQQAIGLGIVDRRARTGVPAIISGDSLAYRTAREVSDAPGQYESGVIAHGPDAEALAQQYADLEQRWAREFFRRGAASFRYLPGPPAASPVSRGSVVKRHGTLTVSWPQVRSCG